MAVTLCSCARLQRSASAPRASVAAHSVHERRNVLLAGASVPLIASSSTIADAAEKIEIPPSQLSTFERAAQKAEVAKRASEELSKVLSAADAPKALRLLFNDAATYDAVTKTGGVDASIILNKSEAGRPESAGLAEYVEKLGSAKAIVDAGNAKLGSGPISWSDMMVLGAKVCVEKEWKGIKLARAAVPSGGETIAKTFGAQWDVTLGRIDSADAPLKSALPPDASATEVVDFMLKLGVKPDSGGPFSPKPPFWEKFAFIIYSATQDDPKAAEEKLASENKEFATWKASYDRERKTVTRTNYEVDFINTFTKLSNLGAKFDPNAYLHSREGVRLA